MSTPVKGYLNKQYKTHEIFENTAGVVEVYVNPGFNWGDNAAKFYIKHTREMDSLVSLQSKLLTVWGPDNCRLYATTEFDSILLLDRRLIYSGGRWYD